MIIEILQVQLASWRGSWRLKVVLQALLALHKVCLQKHLSDTNCASTRVSCVTLTASKLNPGHIWLAPPVLCYWATDSRTTTNPHNPLYILHRWYWMPQSHTWQPLSMCRQNSVRGRPENSLRQERTHAECFFLTLNAESILPQNVMRRKGRQPPGVEPRTHLAWAASALPLSYDSRTTTNPIYRGLWGLVVVWLS